MIKRALGAEIELYGGYVVCQGTEGLVGGNCYRFQKSRWREHMFWNDGRSGTAQRELAKGAYHTHHESSA